MARSLKIILALAILLGISFLIYISKKPAKERFLSNPRINSQAISILIPHLDIAKPERQEFLGSLEVNPTDVVILSTNHFSSSEKEIIYDNTSWSSSSGEIKGSLAKFSPYELSHDLVVNDHGVRNPIVDLKNAFPAAKFTSFLIRQGANDETLNELFKSLDSYCRDEDKNCLVAASVDLSHDNPSQIADLHDQFTISSLHNLDETKIKKAETDSPEVLSLLLKWAKSRNLNNFNLVSQNNSGKKTRNYETETTSWVLGFFGEGNRLEKPSSTLMFTGDIMMDRLVNHRFERTGFDKIFTKFKGRVFAGVDASIANLEGPVNDGPVEDNIEVNNLSFNFPLASLDALKSIKLSGFSLANNHTLNDKLSGLKRTRGLMAERGLFSFGSPSGIDENSSYNLNSDIPVALIGFNQLNGFNERDLESLIKKHKAEGKFVIVYPHWGGEYQTTHNSSQEIIAHKMIDFGADLIVGSHPHVIQDSEIYRDKLIAYSLGNFVFDQLFSRETQQGVILNLLIIPDKVIISFSPVASQDIKLHLARGEQREEILERITPKSGYLTKREDGTIELAR